jgi:hypothetical protein
MENRKRFIIKKGYVFVVVFSLFVAIFYPLYYRLYIATDLSKETFGKLILHGLLMLLTALIPGLILVRWYYKMKNK